MRELLQKKKDQRRRSKTQSLSKEEALKPESEGNFYALVFEPVFVLSYATMAYPWIL